jgi:serine/threonine protein kinase
MTTQDPRDAPVTSRISDVQPKAANRDFESAPHTVIGEREASTVVNAETASEGGEFPPGPELTLGTVLGKYEIRRKLGAGGMGAVYLAFDPMIEREVAVKVLPPEIASRPQALSRFLTEAKATGKLNHPHVVTIYDIGAQGNLNYIVMEVLRGGSVLDSVQRSSGLPWRDACTMVADAADGLSAAHAAGLVHRDIKPENLMLTEDRIVKIVDFGLAKLLDAAHDTRTAVTKAGQVMGTPQFMSPEQFSGASIDHRSDIYSLGGTLFQLLTGRFPFDNCPTVVQLMYAHLEQPVPDPAEFAPGIPAGCREIITRAMAKAPDARYQDAADMARDLRSLVCGNAEAIEKINRKANVETWRTLQSVCIVEPSKVQALMLRDALKKSGVLSIAVHDRALKALGDQSPPADVVVTAMHVPDMSGIDLIKQLREDQRFEQSMLIMNSSDSTIDDLVDAGKSGVLALVSKKSKPDDVLRAVHACTLLNLPAAPFNTSIDPMLLRVLVVSDSGQIPARMVELIHTVGLLDVEITAPMDLASANGPTGRFDLAIHLRSARDAANDTKIYAGLLRQSSALPAVDMTATAVVQIDGGRATLRAVARDGFTAVTRCPLDGARLTRVLQITS